MALPGIILDYEVQHLDLLAAVFDWGPRVEQNELLHDWLVNLSAHGVTKAWADDHLAVLLGQRRRPRGYDIVKDLLLWPLPGDFVHLRELCDDTTTWLLPSPGTAENLPHVVRAYKRLRRIPPLTRNETGELREYWYAGNEYWCGWPDATLYELDVAMPRVETGATSMTPARVTWDVEYHIRLTHRCVFALRWRGDRIFASVYAPPGDYTARRYVDHHWLGRTPRRLQQWVEKEQVLVGAFSELVSLTNNRDFGVRFVVPKGSTKRMADMQLEDLVVIWRAALEQLDDLAGFVRSAPPLVSGYHPTIDNSWLYPDYPESWAAPMSRSD